MDKQQHRVPQRSASAERRTRQDVRASDFRPPSRERRSGMTPSASAVNVGAAVPQPEEEVATSKLHVVCRVRPMSEHEKRSGTVPCITASTERSEVVVVRPQPGSATRQVRSTFSFDNVLTSFSTQNDVFAVTLKPLIREVLCGYEAAAFAYGQTGTGKTYTMEGDLDAEDGMGLVPRASAALIQAISVGNYVSSSITASCLEIYNEELTDLLCQQGQQLKLDLMETGHGVACLGLSEIPVSSEKHVQELICLAQDRRRIAETRINARSSRSHTIFTLRVVVRMRVEGGEVENIGKLHLVDLAGSECAKKASLNEVARSGTYGAGSSVEAERERRNINQSLLTLGRVIAALRGESGRVPYRDSKLTRLLQDALGGSCRTVMIATISPAQVSVDETISTLAYADQAMGIHNRPIAASTLVVRAPSGDVNAACMNGICPTANMLEGGETEMQFAYLTQEVEECKAALARKIRESQDLSRQMLDAETKYASAAAELEQQRFALSERDYVVQNIAAFADRRVEDARCLSAALESSEGRGKALEDSVRSVRQQARNLQATARDHLDSLASSGGVARAEKVAAAIEAASGSWREPLHAVREAFDAQKLVLDGLVCEVHSSGKLLSEVVAHACAKSSEAAASEHAENVERLALIDAATAKAVSALDAGSMRCDASLARYADNLRETALSNTRALTGITLGAAADLEAARVSAASAHQAANEQIDSTVCSAVMGLSEELRTLRTDADRHGESLLRARGRAAEDGLNAVARRACISEAVQRAGDTHTAAVTSTSSPLANALQTLADKLEARHGQVAETLGAVASQLDDVHHRTSEAAQIGQESIQEALRDGSDQLTESWKVIESGFSSLTSSLQGQQGGAAVDHGGSENCTALAEILVAGVSALNAAREDIAREVSDLRQERQAEERLVSLLGRQHEELQADVCRVHSSLSDVNSQLEAARAALKSTEEEQAQRREETVQAMMSGVESILRDGMEGIGRSLKERNDTVRGHLSDAVAHSAASRTMATNAQERAAATGEEASQLAKSWAKSSDAACDHIDSAQLTSLQASQKVHIAATENISGLVAVVGQLQATQDAVQLKWNASREVIACRLDEVASSSALALQETSALRQDVLEECTQAQAHVAVRSREDRQQTALLSDLRQLQSECSQEADASEARHHGTLSALGESALAIAERAALRAPEADAILEAVRSHAATAAATAAAHGKALEATETTVAGLAPQVEAAHECIVEHVVQIQALGAEVAASLKSAGSTMDTQRMAFDVANAATEDRWLQLQKSHTAVLKATEATAAAASSQGGSLKCQAEARKEEERADVSHRRLSTELEEHRVKLTHALTEHQQLWRVGLSDKPMFAFTEDAIFEDELNRELPGASAALPAHVVEDLARQRPTEQALAAEFQASHRQLSEKVTALKEDEIRHETPRNKKPAEKNAVDEVSGYPRMALRELQVGGTGCC